MDYSNVQPRVPKLSCSRSKAEFLAHLGLPEDEQSTVNLYREMMNEAAEGRERSCGDINNLTPEARNMRPPYSSNQIQPGVLHQVVMQIYRNASLQTRRIYDLGREIDGVTEDNWVIRWCLWHVFRYRDERNRTRNVSSVRRNTTYYTYREPGSAEDENDSEGYAKSQPSPSRNGRGLQYDPVRDLS